MSNKPHLTRAARIVLLRDLRRAGQLDGLTLDQIAERLAVGHRSTILRTLRDLDALEGEIATLREAWDRPDAASSIT